MKNELNKWKKKIDEISNCVWKVTLIHELGASVQKTGENLNIIEKEVESLAIEMNKQIKEKILT